MKSLKLNGLVAATHTPFNPDGSLNLGVVERQAGHLLEHGIETAFICGSTGESASLACDERLQMAVRWMEVTKGTRMQVVVHVGANALADAKLLAEQAGRLGAAAVAALAPSYFKPRNVAELVDWCAAIASAALETPFYFYDIPSLTGVNLSMPDFLDQAGKRIGNLRGIKFTNTDLMAYQQCLQLDGGAFDIPWGVDECLLAALALGATGAVGSSYNFAAPIYLRLLRAFGDGNLAAARDEQFRSVRLIKLLAGYGYMGAAKAVMAMLGVDVGPARLPNETLTIEQARDLRGQLERQGLFELLTARSPQLAAAVARTRRGFSEPSISSSAVSASSAFHRDMLDE